MENHLKNAWIVLNAIYFNHQIFFKFSWIYEDGKLDYKNENIARKTLKNMLTLFNNKKKPFIELKKKERRKN